MMVEGMTKLIYRDLGFFCMSQGCFFCTFGRRVLLALACTLVSDALLSHHHFLLGFINKYIVRNQTTISIAGMEVIWRWLKMWKV